MELLKSWIRNLLFLKPQLSIIIPFYNSEDYILKCMESIVLHTKVPYEIVCVNDGSTDKYRFVLCKTYGNFKGKRKIYRFCG